MRQLLLREGERVLGRGVVNHFSRNTKKNTLVNICVTSDRIFYESRGSGVFSTDIWLRDVIGFTADRRIGVIPRVKIYYKTPGSRENCLVFTDMHDCRHLPDWLERAGLQRMP